MTGDYNKENEIELGPEEENVMEEEAEEQFNETDIYLGIAPTDLNLDEVNTTDKLPEKSRNG